MSKKLIFTMLITISSSSFADYFLPLNDLKIPPSSTKVDSGISEDTFNMVIDHVEEIYTPVLKAMGKKLLIERRWSDGTVNAYASRVGSNTYKVVMFGGLARHEEATADGFAMVLCHEIGHHIGGAPRYGKNSQWAATEGQSDYWATSICAKKIYTGADNWGTLLTRYKSFKSMNPTQRNSNSLYNDHVFEQCSNVFTDKDKIAICVRSSMGGLSLARLLGSLRSSTMPDFQTKDTKVVSTTYEKHPAAQCRLDTYFAGALCDTDRDNKTDQNDPFATACSRKNGDKTGVRPLCWFSPKDYDGTTKPDNGGGNTDRAPFSSSKMRKSGNSQRYY